MANLVGNLIDNSGAQQMDMGVLVGKKQLLIRTPPRPRRRWSHSTTRRRGPRHAAPLHRGDGASSDGAPVWIMYYAYTVYGVWTADGPRQARRDVPRDLDAMLALCEKAKKKGMAGWTYAGKYPDHLLFSLYPFIARSAAGRSREILRTRAQRLEGPGRQVGVRGVLRALQEARWTSLRHLGIDHIQSQTAWARARHPSSSRTAWVENESRAMASRGLQPGRQRPHRPTALSTPFGTIWASGGEPLHRAGQGDKTRGGMEQLADHVSGALSRTSRAR